MRYACFMLFKRIHLEIGKEHVESFSSSNSHNIILLPVIKSIEPLISSHRHKTSIDVLFTIWKFISGVPDHEVNNNNRQTVINSKLRNHINKLIDVINVLTNLYLGGTYINI